MSLEEKESIDGETVLAFAQVYQTLRKYDIVLPWTDKGYGVVVKTTGRTLRETERIGEIIEERYGGI